MKMPETFSYPHPQGNPSHQGRDSYHSYPQVEDMPRRSSRSRRSSTSDKYSAAEEARPRKLSDFLPPIEVNGSVIYQLYINRLWSRLLTTATFQTSEPLSPEVIKKLKTLIELERSPKYPDLQASSPNMRNTKSTSVKSSRTTNPVLHSQPFSPTDAPSILSPTSPILLSQQPRKETKLPLLPRSLNAKIQLPVVLKSRC
jgi:hypothetical protein